MTQSFVGVTFVVVLVVVMFVSISVLKLVKVGGNWGGLRVSHKIVQSLEVVLILGRVMLPSEVSAQDKHD